MVTLKDVAEKAAVSIKTVSRVLNREAGVAIETREKVQQAIVILGYRPNLSARIMRTGRSNLIGIISNRALRGPWSGGIMSGVFEQLEQAEMRCIIAPLGDKTKMNDAIDFLLDHQIDALIYISLLHRPINVDYTNLTIPLVLCNGYDERQRFTSVVPDDYQGGYIACQHLIDQGYKRIAHIGLNERIDATQLRMQGFLDAMANANLPVEKEYLQMAERCLFDQNSQHHVKDIIRKWHQEDNMPDSLIIGNDQHALAVWGVMQEIGCSIPDNLAIIGYDDYKPITEWLQPDLSTIDIGYKALGAFSAQQAVKLIGEPIAHSYPKFKIEAQLVRRRSTPSIKQ